MPRGRPAKYPWDEWCDPNRSQKRIPLTQGEHFPENVKVASFRAECHNAAKRRGGKADTRIVGNTVLFRYIEP